MSNEPKNIKTTKKRFVFIRGLCREAQHWHKFPDLFRSEFPNDQIEFLEIPGNGKYFNKKSLFSIKENVNFIRNNSLLLKEGPVIVISISLGSMITIDWAHHFPDEIEACVLINSSSARHSPFYERLRPTAIIALLKSLFSKSNIESEKQVLELTTNLIQDLKPYISKNVQIITERPIKTSNAFIQLWSAANYSWPRTKPSCPILLLASKLDRLASVNCTLSLAKSWELSAEIHPTAGHDLPLDDGKWIIQKIKEKLFPLLQADR